MDSEVAGVHLLSGQEISVRGAGWVKAGELVNSFEFTGKTMNVVQLKCWKAEEKSLQRLQMADGWSPSRTRRGEQKNRELEQQHRMRANRLIEDELRFSFSPRPPFAQNFIYKLLRTTSLPRALRNASYRSASPRFFTVDLPLPTYNLRVIQYFWEFDRFFSCKM